MADEKQEIKQVIYKLEKANNCRTIYVNGVWGGINYPNEIRMGLTTEMTADPESVIHEVTPEGLGKEIRRIPEVQKDILTVIREIQVVAVMSPAAAEYIGNWLLEQVKLAKGVEK